MGRSRGANPISQSVEFSEVNSFRIEQQRNFVRLSSDAILVTVVFSLLHGNM